METYAYTLYTLAKRIGCRTYILQKSRVDSDLRIAEHLRVISATEVSDLRKRLEELCRKSKGIVIYFSTYLNMPPPEGQASIWINHGIHHDGLFDRYRFGTVTAMLVDLKRRILLFKMQNNEFRMCSSVSRVVCVDTNFINAMRLAFPMYDWGERLVYVPNFADIQSPDVVNAKWGGAKAPNIVIFARRFVMPRGVQLWLECLKSLAPQFPNVEFRVVGCGEPANSLLLDLSCRHQNIKVYQKPHSEMEAEFQAAHISVIPSLFSEGTSLSCIESMAAGCAIVASSVGGLCNLVIPGYDGILIPPVQEEFTRAVSQLLKDRNLAMELGMRGYDMARTAFARDLWEERMIEVLLQAFRHPSPGRPMRRVRPPKNAI